MVQKELVRYSVRSGFRVLLDATANGANGKVAIKTANDLRVEAGIEVSYSAASGQAEIELSGPLLLYKDDDDETNPPFTATMEADMNDLAQTTIGTFEFELEAFADVAVFPVCLLYTSPSPRDS